MWMGCLDFSFGDAFWIMLLLRDDDDVEDGEKKGGKGGKWYASVRDEIEIHKFCTLSISCSVSFTCHSPRTVLNNLYFTAIHPPSSVHAISLRRSHSPFNCWSVYCNPHSFILPRLIPTPINNVMARKSEKRWNDEENFFSKIAIFSVNKFFVLHKKQTNIHCNCCFPRCIHPDEKKTERNGRWRWREKKLCLEMQPISAMPDYTCECTKCSRSSISRLTNILSFFFADVVRCSIDDVALIDFLLTSLAWKDFSKQKKNCWVRATRGNGRDRTDGSGAVIALVTTTICTSLSPCCGQKSFDCWFFCFVSIIKLVIIVFFMMLFLVFSFSPSASHSLIAKWRNSQSASATWSRCSCSLVIDIFDSSFFFSSLSSCYTLYSHNFMYVYWLRWAVFLNEFW